MAFLIILGALWSYPIVAFFAIYSTRQKLKYRKYFFITALAGCVLATIGLLTDISTTVSALDWLLLTSFYLLICLLAWLTQCQRSRLLKLAGVLAMFLVFGAGYISGTLGILGVGFIVGEYDTDEEAWIGDGLIVKEHILGNAISDHRGKRVEVCRTFKWFPVVEWPVLDKTYDNMITYGKPLTINYTPAEGKIYLSTSMVWGDSTYNWADTIQLKKR